MRHPGRVWYVNWSADGRLLVTTCTDGAARIWEAFSGHLLAEPFTHEAGKQVRRAAFNSSGARLLTAGFDGTIRLWDMSFLNPPLPVPEWLPELAEALGGKRIGPRDTPVAVEGNSLLIARDRIRTSGAEDDYYRRWARWMLQQRFVQPVNAFR
jgi:hypothetical protein